MEGRFYVTFVKDLILPCVETKAKEVNVLDPRAVVHDEIGGMIYNPKTWRDSLPKEMIADADWFERR